MGDSTHLSTPEADHSRAPSPGRSVEAGGGGLEVVELVADEVGVGVGQLVEDVEGLPPGGVGGVGVAGGGGGVAELGEGVGLGVAVAEVAVDVEGVPVARGGVVVVGQAAVNVAEAVPDI